MGFEKDALDFSDVNSFYVWSGNNPIFSVIDYLHIFTI